MRNQKYIGTKEIKVLTKCSEQVARELRIEVLSTYMKYLPPKGKVRLDKFLYYYDDKYLIDIYESMWKISKDIILAY